MNCLQESRRRWGVVLAGGDGVRLRPLTRLICGDQRPKQFCPVFGSTTLLGATVRRIAPLIAEERTLVSLTAQHEPWYVKEANMPTSQRVIQPENKGTAPPIVHSLLSIARQDPDAIAAILPCDHHYSKEPMFQAYLESAFQGAQQHPGAVILLGARPDYPEVEYGWIEMGPGCDQRDIFRVKDFWEKPSLEVAQALLARRSLWNTFVMVGSVPAFLRLIASALPELPRMLSDARLWSGGETSIEDKVYGRIPSMNFSHCILAPNPDKLRVLRMADVGWSDLGDPARVVSTARRNGWEASWLDDWKLAPSAVWATQAAV